MLHKKLESELDFRRMEAPKFINRVEALTGLQAVVKNYASPDQAAQIKPTAQALFNTHFPTMLRHLAERLLLLVLRAKQRVGGVSPLLQRRDGHLRRSSVKAKRPSLIDSENTWTVVNIIPVLTQRKKSGWLSIKGSAHRDSESQRHA